MSGFENDVDELVREGIKGAEERFEGIEAGYREAARGAEDLEEEGPDFGGPIEELAGLLEQVRSNAEELESAKAEMERKAGLIEEEHRKRVEALAEAPEEAPEEASGGARLP